MKNSAICPLDGRYSHKLGALRSAMSEAAFSASRLRAECAWFEALSSLKLPKFQQISSSEKKRLLALCKLTEEDLSVLHDLEFSGYCHLPPTKHDVKAVEYFLKLKLKKTSLADRVEWIHFALTSEDINSAAYAMLLSDGLEKAILPVLTEIYKKLVYLSKKEASSVLLARTHGQPAVPTTFGKEIRVFAQRLKQQLDLLKTGKVSCKFGGAVGNYNAHVAAFPKVDWSKTAQKFVSLLNKKRKFKIFLSPISTQVDNRDSYAEIFDNLRRINIILMDFCQDMWQYISRGLVLQKIKPGEVGSSTMPQKINPIDFENAEGNLQLSDALLGFFSQKLPVSRLQRDLSDSTVLRNMGVAFGYALTAYLSILTGLEKVSFDKKLAREELNKHPEVLAEAIQTLLRAAGFENPYETLRDFTRGKVITQDLLKEFINNLKTDAFTKQKLQALTPENYVGKAVRLAEGKYD